jgi:hypothetical protein
LLNQDPDDDHDHDHGCCLPQGIEQLRSGQSNSPKLELTLILFHFGAFSPPLSQPLLERCLSRLLDRPSRVRMCASTCGRCTHACLPFRVRGSWPRTQAGCCPLPLHRNTYTAYDHRTRERERERERRKGSDEFVQPNLQRQPFPVRSLLTALNCPRNHSGSL